MKNLKKFLLTVLTLIACFAFVGCDPKVSPEEASVALYNVIIKCDFESASKLNITDDEVTEIINTYKSKRFDSGDFANLDSESAEKLNDLLLEKLKLTECRAETISKDENTAKVKLYIKPLNYTKVVVDATKNTFSSVTLEDILSEDSKEKFASLYPEKFSEALKNAEIIQEETEIEIELSRLVTTWEPKTDADVEKIVEASLYIDNVDEELDKVSDDFINQFN